MTERINADRLRTLLRYNPATGFFYWKKRSTDPSLPLRKRGRLRAWDDKYAGKRAGTTNRRYHHIAIEGATYAAHRLAWLYVHGEWPKGELDHIDLDGTHNAISNLRQASRGQNNSNKRAFSATGLKGVYTTEANTFRTEIKHNKKRYHLGTFATPEEAHAAYCKAAKELHGEFARTS